MTCYCGGVELATCCGPYLDGEPAPTAEALMRSRFSAFVCHNDDHLFRTWHPKTRPQPPYSDPDTTWVKLTIIDVVDGQIDDKSGIVEFDATYDVAGQQSVMRERSTFTKRAGRWMYVDGIHE